MRSRTKSKRHKKILRSAILGSVAKYLRLRRDLAKSLHRIFIWLHFGNTGAWGEAMAERAVRKARCQILARNWRSRRLEADIVALERRTLIVVEVKTRHERSMRDFPAHEAVTPEKQHHLDLLALAFKRSNGPLCRRLGVKGARLDTIEVYYRRTILKRHRVVAIMWHRG